MPPGYVLPNPRFRALDAYGDPLAGGKLYSYAAGTSTPLAVYTDAALSVPHAHPIILSAAGETTIYIGAGVLYKFILTGADDVEQWTIDDVQLPNPEAAEDPDPVPTGAIFPFGGVAAPTGYVLCDGSAISRVTFATLFSVVGVAFGVGDGSTTFNVPDLRQRFPLGKAAAGTGAVLGVTGGAIDHTHSVETTDHTHTVPPDGWNNPTQGGLASAFVGYFAVSDGGGGGFTTATNDQASGAAGEDTLTSGTANPPFQSVNYIIKT